MSLLTSAAESGISANDADWDTITKLQIENKRQKERIMQLELALEWVSKTAVLMASEAYQVHCKANAELKREPK